MDQKKMTKRESYSSSLYAIEEFSYIGTCETQEDATGCLIEGNTSVMVLCDGIGGLERGDIAAQTAVQAVLQQAAECEWKEDPVSFIKLLVTKANDAVFDAVDEQGKTIQGGCTIVIALTVGRRLYVANVGDSRVYLIRKDGMEQISIDHNYANQLARQLKAGEIDRNYYNEQIPRGASLTSYLGMGELQECFVTKEPIMLDRDEVVFLESDGLYKLVDEKEIYQNIRNNLRVLDEAGEALYACAEGHRTGYQDNTSIIMFRIK